MGFITLFDKKEKSLVINPLFDEEEIQKYSQNSKQYSDKCIKEKEKYEKIMQCFKVQTYNDIQEAIQKTFQEKRIPLFLTSSTYY